jgi:hypothetical protein
MLILAQNNLVRELHCWLIIRLPSISESLILQQFYLIQKKISNTLNILQVVLSSYVSLLDYFLYK